MQLVRVQQSKPQSASSHSQHLDSKPAFIEIEDSGDEKVYVEAYVEQMRTGRKRTSLRLEDIESFIRPHIAKEVEPTLIDWLGHLNAPWKLDYEEDDTSSLSYVHVLQEIHDMVCSDYGIQSTFQGQVPTNSVFYKRVRHLLIIHFYAYMYWQCKQHLYDHRKGLYKIALAYVQNELIDLFVDMSLLNDASVDEQLVSAKDAIQEHIEEALETESWFYERPKTASTVCSFYLCIVLCLYFLRLDLVSQARQWS